MHQNQEALDARRESVRAGHAEMLRPAEDANRCWMRWPKADSTRRSAERGATRKNRAPRSASIRSATRWASGTRRTSVRSCGTSSIRASTRAKASACSRCRTGPSWTSGCTSTWKKFPSCRCTSPKEREVVVRGGSIVLCIRNERAAAGREDQTREVPHAVAGMRAVHRRDSLGCGHACRKIIEEMIVVPPLGAREPRHRSRRRRLDGDQEARGIFLMLCHGASRNAVETFGTASWSSICGKELLRFTTAGSVDDGKSTLIGRLLHDIKAVYEDQLASVQKSRINRSTGPIDFSLLTDGLRAEREQGITIDVAYRYFTRRGANSSSRIRRGTSSTRATWPRVRRRPTCGDSDRCDTRACCPRRAGTHTSRRCWGFRTSSRQSTRWTWLIIRRAYSVSWSRTLRRWHTT